MIVRRFDELTTHQLYDLLRLRSDVFVVEQACAYPELDGRDREPATRHWWIERAGEIAAALRVLDDTGTARIGRVVTARAWRGLGLAGDLMAAVVADLDTTGRPAVLDAQSRLAPWYEGFGFRVAGDEFVEDGIAHLPMRRPATRGIPH